MKTKSLFDHINHVTQKQTQTYWDDMTDADKKSWSNYMVNRFLSMKMEWITMVNDIQNTTRTKGVVQVVFKHITKG